MSDALSDETVKTLDAVAGILIRCFFITVGAMVFTWFVWLAIGDVIHSIHHQLYGLTSREFDLYFLYSMTIMKGLNVMFFLFPTVAIKWYLRGKR